MSRKLSTGILTIVLSLGALLILFPFYITVVTSLKTPEESTKNFFSLPHSFYLGNFKSIISDANFFTYFWNSIFVTVLSVVAIVIISPMVSYAIARNMNRSKFYKFVYFYFVIGIFMPFQVIMLPLTKLVSNLHLMNQFGLIALYVTFGLIQGVFLYVGYLKSVPEELYEAAKIDGCSVLQTFFHIVFPVLKPMTATVIIIKTLWIFNDFLLPVLILNKSSKMWTLPLFQYNFQSQYTFNFNLAFASFMFTIVPMMIVFIFMQKYIVKGLTAGSVK